MSPPQRSHLYHVNLARRAAVSAVAALAAVALAGCGENGTTPTSDGATSASTSTTSAPSSSASQPTTSAPTSSPVATPSTSPTARTPAAGPHNQADIDFAAGMVPHHQQALVMADMALAHGGTEEFVALAKAVKAAQKPEIEQMSGWLVGWGQQVPDGSGHLGHADMGMMSQQDLDDLDAMAGSGFEGMWLTMMVEHHEGAVDMARTELDKGTNPEAKKLAQAIIKAQTVEIAQMKAMANERAN